MTNYIYVSKFKYITNFEQYFITANRSGHKFSVLVLEKSRFKNEFYKYTIRILILVEKFIQRYLKISRNFQEFEICAIEIRSLIKPAHFEPNDVIIGLIKNGFLVQKIDGRDFKYPYVSLLELQRAQKNISDQMEVGLYQYDSLTNKELMKGLYEIDRLFLNNKVIFLRRALILAERVLF